MPNNILITPGSASIQFSGSAANTIRLQVEASGSIAFYGNSGSLFGITDQLSGSLMSVNDISGLPILEVFSDDRIVMGSFNKNTLVVTGSRVGIDKANPTADLDISGSVFITGSLRMSSGGITGSLFGTSSLATTASYVSPSGLPTGTVSSSAQINTGSFTGSFTGTLIGTSSWASNVISSSFATTSSAATSITFTPSTASFSTSASYALSASYAPSAPGGGVTSLTAGNGLTGGTITSTGTITLDTGSAHFLDGVKKELNTEGVISSSVQINTGSFTGSFTGTLIGTSSWANNATTASYFTGSVTFPSGLIVTGSILATTVSASLFLGPLTGTASFATSASFAPDTTFPFTGSAIISGSLITTGSVRILSGSISSSGPQTGLLLSGSNTTLTIIPESDGIRYYSVNTGHTFRVGNVDALNIQAFSLSPITANQSTLGISGVRWGTGFINNIISSGSITNTGSLNILSGSINITNGGVTSSLFGTASNATSASYALSASYAPGGAGTVTQVNTGDGLSGGPITGTGTITLNTSSVHFLDGVKKELNTEGVISSSAQVSYTGLSNVPSGIVSSSTQVTSLLPAGTVSSSGQVSYTGLSNVPSGIVSSSAQVTSLLPAGTVSSSGQVSYTGLSDVPANIVSSSAFTSPSQGTVRATINNVQTDVDTGLQTGDSPTFTALSVSTSITASIISSSVITGSHVQLVNVTDTTSANKILVLNTATNKIFTTASVGGGATFPFTGSAIISGSLITTGSLNILSGSINVTNGGVTSSLFGTASFATSASYVLPSGLPAGTISSSLQFNTVTTPFTGSFTGSFTGALTHFSPSTLKLTVGTTAPTSPAVNDLWVDTN